VPVWRTSFGEFNSQMDTLSRFLRRSSRNRRAMALGNNNASVERVLQEASLLQTASSAAPPLRKSEKNLEPKFGEVIFYFFSES